MRVDLASIVSGVHRGERITRNFPHVNKYLDREQGPTKSPSSLVFVATFQTDASWMALSGSESQPIKY